MVELTEDQKPYIVFGDGMYGEKTCSEFPNITQLLHHKR